MGTYKSVPQNRDSGNLRGTKTVVTAEFRDLWITIKGFLIYLKNLFDEPVLSSLSELMDLLLSFIYLINSVSIGLTSSLFLAAPVISV